MKFEWTIDDGYINRKPMWKFEIDDEDFEGMTDDEIEDHAFDVCREDEVWNHCSLVIRRVD